MRNANHLPWFRVWPWNNCYMPYVFAAFLVTNPSTALIMQYIKCIFRNILFIIYAYIIINMSSYIELNSSLCIFQGKLDSNYVNRVIALRFNTDYVDWASQNKMALLLFFSLMESFVVTVLWNCFGIRTNHHYWCFPFLHHVCLPDDFCFLTEIYFVYYVLPKIWLTLQVLVPLIRPKLYNHCACRWPSTIRC